MRVREGPPRAGPGRRDVTERPRPTRVSRDTRMVGGGRSSPPSHPWGMAHKWVVQLPVILPLFGGLPQGGGGGGSLTWTGRILKGVAHPSIHPLSTASNSVTVPALETHGASSAVPSRERP